MVLVHDFMKSREFDVSPNTIETDAGWSNT